MRKGHARGTPTYPSRLIPNLTWSFSEPHPLDGYVWEIMVNGPGAIFTKRHSGAGGYHHEVFHDDEHVVRVLTKILDDASRSHRKLDPAEGLQDAQLDNGSHPHRARRCGPLRPGVRMNLSGSQGGSSGWVSCYKRAWRRCRERKRAGQASTSTAERKSL